MTIYVDSPRAVFIHIPKTGGTSMVGWLTKYVPTAMWVSKKSPRHAPWSSVKKLIPEPGLVFTTIRNPWARVVSAYHYHNCQGVDGQHMHFKEWVLTDLRCASQPISYFVDDSVFILRLENIEEEFKQIQEYFNVWSPLSVKNTTKHKHYTKYYDDETRQFIADKFKDDIERYKYQYE